MSSRWASLSINLSKELAGAIAIAATASYFIVAFNDYRASRNRVTYAELESLRTIKSLQEVRAEIDEKNARTAQLLERLSKLAQAPAPNPSRLAQQITLVQHNLDAQKDQLKDLRSNIDSLRKAIESSPEKAVTIPLLTKDLDDFKTSSQHDIDSLRAEMLRGYELNKWLIGLMLAAVFGIVFKGILESRTSPGHPPSIE
jgi:hypothetical protein